MKIAFIAQFLALGISLTGALAANADIQPGSSSSQGKDSPEREEMNVLAKRAFELSLGAITKSGGVYPFALVSNGKDVSTMTAGPKQEKKSQEKWFNQLSFNVRQRVQEKENAKIAALVRMHSIKNDEEEEVQGVWCLVDHKNHRPWVAFLPLVEQKDGKHKPGDLIYYATEEKIFNTQLQEEKDNSK